ncbi:hypothetical protein PoB_001977000 [Plakobranchus ocellatus]|uniref:Uncharacterized protein n=1 Tax=Plakobranchus ocellatus TaxID=259542 RepID=A0AAV3ZFA4_9GAST|nr:hypothetical protein PoB_001977000 [Plakobranchus ocellatus]
MQLSQIVADIVRVHRRPLESRALEVEPVSQNTRKFVFRIQRPPGFCLPCGLLLDAAERLRTLLKQICPKLVSMDFQISIEIFSPVLPSSPEHLDQS